MLQVVFGKFYRQIKNNTMMTFKNNTMMTLSWLHLILFGFENLQFCRNEYRLSLLQVPNPLVVCIKFYGG